MSIIFDVYFSDGTVFKLLDFGFIGYEILLLSKLHGKVISIRSYPYGAANKIGLLFQNRDKIIESKRKR